MTKLSNIINRHRMFVGGELGNDTADLLEEQAREIEKLKAALAKRVLTADEQRKDFDGLLKNWSKQGYEIKELRTKIEQLKNELSRYQVVGAALVDKESREAIMFYSSDMIPSDIEFKDKFELITVYEKEET